jgi:hypothetical protein
MERYMCRRDDKLWAKLSWQDGNMSLCGRDEEIRVKRGWQDGNVICMEEMIEEG